MRSFRSATDQLDQALDAAVAGDATILAQHDPDAAATWDLLARWAALGGLDGLDPNTADSSPHDEDLIHAHERPAIMPHTLTLSQPIRAPLPHSRPARRSPLSVTWSPLAWLLIVAIGGGAIWGLWPLLNDREPTPTPLTAFQPDSSEATPEVAIEANPDLVANWAGEGNSWIVSDKDPIWGEATILDSLRTDGQRLLSMPLVVEDSVYFSMTGPKGDVASGKTIRYDLAAKEIIWESPTILTDYLTLDGSLLIGRTVGLGDEPSSSVGLDLESGSRFGTTFLTWTEDNPAAYMPWQYSEPGATFWLDSRGLVVGMPALDPTLMVVYGTLFPVHGTIDVGAAWDGNLRYSNLVIGTDYIYAVRPSMTLVQYDRQSGMEVRSLNLVDALLRDVEGAFLQLQDNRLIVTAIYPYDPDSTMQPSAILILDSNTLAPLTGAEVPDLQGQTVAVRDWVYVTARLNANDPVRLYRVHPVGGTLGAPISDFETQTTGGLSMVMAGETLLLLDNTMNTVTAIDPEANTVVETIQLPALGASPEASAYMGAIQIWDGHPVLVRGDGRIIVIGLED